MPGRVAKRGARCEALDLEKSGRHAEAALCFKKAKAYAKAAAAYEASGDVEVALLCWRKAGDRRRENALLERTANPDGPRGSSSD